MKVTIYELLGMVKDGKAPKKIMYNNETFTLREEKDDYANQNHWFTDRVCLLDLNKEVEIIEEEPRNIEVCGSLFTRSEYNRLAGIEEDKKIRKIKIDYSPDIEEKIFYDDGDKPNHCILGDAGTELLINKINEIIDYINGGTNEHRRIQ